MINFRNNKPNRRDYYDQRNNYSGNGNDQLKLFSSRGWGRLRSCYPHPDSCNCRTYTENKVVLIFFIS